MIKNEDNNLKGKLDNFEGKSVLVTQEGFLQSKFTIQSLKYEIKYDILSILDENAQNYLNINLNQVYKLDISGTGIIFYMDEDIKISLENKKTDS